MSYRHPTMQEEDLGVYVSPGANFPSELLNLLDRRPRAFDAMCQSWVELPFEYQLEIVDRVLPGELGHHPRPAFRYLDSQRMALAEVASRHSCEVIRFRVAAHQGEAIDVSEDKDGLVRAGMIHRLYWTADAHNRPSLSDDFWKLSTPERLMLSGFYCTDVAKRLSEATPTSVEPLEVLGLYLSSLTMRRHHNYAGRPLKFGAIQDVAAALMDAPDYVSEWVTVNPFVDCRFATDDLTVVLQQTPKERLKFLTNEVRCIRGISPGVAFWVLADVLKVLDEAGTLADQQRLRRRFAGQPDFYSFADLYLWDEIWHSRKENSVEALIAAIRQMDEKRDSLDESQYTELVPELIQNPRIRLCDAKKRQFRAVSKRDLVFPESLPGSNSPPIDFTSPELTPIRIEPLRDPPWVLPSLGKLISPNPLQFEQLLRCFSYLPRELRGRIIEFCSDDHRFHPIHVAALKKASQGPARKPRDSAGLRIGAAKYQAEEPGKFWARPDHERLALANGAHVDVQGFCEMLVTSVRSSDPPPDEALARVVAEFLLTPETEAAIAGSQGQYTDVLLELAESLPPSVEKHFSEYAVFTFNITDEQLTRLLSSDLEQVMTKLGLIARLSRRIDPPETWCFICEATMNAEFGKRPLGMNRTLAGRVHLWKRCWFRNMDHYKEALVHLARCALCSQCLSAKGLWMYGDTEPETWLGRCQEAWQLFLERKPAYEKDPGQWTAMIYNFPEEGFDWVYNRLEAKAQSSPRRFKANSTASVFALLGTTIIILTQCMR